MRNSENIVHVVLGTAAITNAHSYNLIQVYCYLKICSEPTIPHKIFETNSSFHVK